MPALKDATPKTKILGIRVSVKAHNSIAQAAAEANQSLSDFLVSSLREDSKLLQILRADKEKIEDQIADLLKQREEAEKLIEELGGKLIEQISSGKSIGSLDEQDEATQNQIFGLLTHPFMREVFQRMPELATQLEAEKRSKKSKGKTVGKPSN